MIKPYIQLSIKTKTDMTNWSVGREILSQLCSLDKRLVPEFISHTDRFTDPFVNIEQCNPHWAVPYKIRVNGVLYDALQHFLWKRKRSIKHRAEISHTLKNARGQTVPGGIYFTADWNKTADWIVLYTEWCRTVLPQLGMLHLFTEPELQPHERNASFQIGSFNAGLSPDVPNVAWAMFFGGEFASEVDAGRVGEAGFPIEKIGDGYLIRVTDDICDVLTDFAMFSRRRAQLKELFRDDLFLVRNEPELFE